MSRHQDTLTELENVLRALSDYSARSGRLGLHDLALLEELRTLEHRIDGTPEQAMILLLECNEMVYLNDGYHEDYEDAVLAALDLIGMLKPNTED